MLNDVASVPSRVWVTGSWSGSTAVTGVPDRVARHHAVLLHIERARASGEYGPLIGHVGVRRPRARPRPVAVGLGVPCPHLYVVARARRQARDDHAPVHAVVGYPLRAVLALHVVVGDGRPRVRGLFPCDSHAVRGAGYPDHPRRRRRGGRLIPVLYLDGSPTWWPRCCPSSARRPPSP